MKKWSQEGSTKHNKPSSDRKFIKKTPLKIFSLTAIIGIIGFAGWSFYNYQKAKEKVVKLSTIEGQQELAEQSLENLLNRIKSHMILPEDEEPTVATITSVETLIQEQPFFKGAQNGDKVIVYVGAKKAIIYSPGRNVIVNVGAVYVEANEEDSQLLTEELEKESDKLDIEIRNGTKIAGLAQTISSKLETTSGEYNIVDVTDASSKEISQTLVIDLGKTDNKDLVASVGSVLGAETTDRLPEGEKESSAEVLVIIGEDQIQSPTSESSEKEGE